jgi:DNA-binding protein HU-beta
VRYCPDIDVRLEPRRFTTFAARRFFGPVEQGRNEMTKTDLVAAFADRADINRNEAARLVDLIFDPASGVIANTLRSGDKVQISGFGTFEAKKRKARTGRNPRTGEPITIPPSMTATFRAGKALKDAVGE